MAYPYSDPRVSTIIPNDEISTVHFRRSSRKYSEIKLSEVEAGTSKHIESINLLESIIPTDQQEDENGTDGDFIFVEEYYAPEGKWGWCIVAAAFWSNFVVDGISLCYGVMTEEITAMTVKNESMANETSPEAVPSEEGNITITQFNTVGSILLAVTLLMGPIASVMSEKISFRKTAICGSVISTIGIFLPWAVSPDKPNFWAFVIGFGVLTGIGFGILFTTSVVIVGKYFDKNIAIATGVTVAGTGIGTLVMAKVINEVMKLSGWQGAILFQAVIAAISVLFGAVYQPLPKRVVKVPRSQLNSKKQTLPIKQQLKELLTSPSYLLVSISGSFVMMGYFAPFGFLVDSAKVYIEEDAAVDLLLYLGLSNAVGRVLFGLLANKIGHSLHISNIALTAGGLVTVFYPFATTHFWLIICSIVFGLYAAVFATLRSVIIKKVVGEEKFNVGFGLSLVFMGVATLFSNSLGGYLKDTTQTYDMSFYCAGIWLILSGVISYFVPLIYGWEKRRNARDDLK